MALPSSMKAIKVLEGCKAAIQTVPLPKLRPNYILVKTTTVALNPTDWKHVSVPPLSKPGATVGCDYAGTVVEVGPEVTKSFSKGDRIAGFAHGVNFTQPEDGAFAEYIVAVGDLQMKTPDNLSDEEAATLGVGVSTVGQGLYQSLKLPLPNSGKKAGYTLLVYGGSTATGSLAIQYGVLSGCEVITTCSKHNFDFVKSLGAKEAFDYKDPDVAKKIREYTNDSLTKAFDCISEGASPKICSEAISSKGGKVSYLLQTKHDRTDVEAETTLAYTIANEDMVFAGNKLPASQADFDHGKMFWELSTQLLADGKIKVHPPRVGKGFEGVLEGMEEMKAGKVSGTKLVYKIS